MLSNSCIYLISGDKNEVLLDKCMFGGGLSYWPGFFTQDMMRASAYRYADISTKINKPRALSLLIVDRKKTRSFNNGKKWIRIIGSRFGVYARMYIINHRIYPYRTLY